MSRSKYCCIHNGIQKTWYVDRLWQLAKTQEPFELSLSELEGWKEQNYWFHGQEEPTVANILKHWQRAEKADLNYPIILNACGEVMDGIHRLVKADRLGQKTISAVRFQQDPEPDLVEAVGGKDLQNS